MVVYCGFLIGLQLIIFGSELGNSNDKGCFTTFMSFCMMLPFYGRIFGWW